MSSGQDSPKISPKAGAETSRLTSLDQFRGYTVLGMFLVNFVGSFVAIKAMLPVLKHHHTYCSYADTIMPHFLFAVGFSFRLTFLKRQAEKGTGSAVWHAISRNFALLVVAFFVHRLDTKYESWSQLVQAFQEKGAFEFLRLCFEREFFQTLAHIAVTSLWILPVIGGPKWLRIAYMVGSGALFHYLSEQFYYRWEMTRPGIDGGPLGFLGWSIPAILGSLAYDWVMADRKSALLKLVVSGLAVMLFAYGLSCLVTLSPLQMRLIEPPFILPANPPSLPPPGKEYIWTMSQRAGSISYVAFGGGFSLLVYAVFLWVCDFANIQVGIFRTLGVNALAGYILHSMVDDTLSPFTPKDSPLWWVFASFSLYLLICYVCLRHLEKHKIYLRL